MDIDSDLYHIRYGYWILDVVEYLIGRRGRVLFINC